MASMVSLFCDLALCRRIGETGLGCCCRKRSRVEKPGGVREPIIDIRAPFLGEKVMGPRAWTEAEDEEPVPAHFEDWVSGEAGGVTKLVSSRSWRVGEDDDSELLKG